ncbi:MAG: hypothetical protein IJG65_10250 [Synergistaceae bacterium]|nr:hypothetical protein [Synergistaceae bacterium]
MTNVTVPVSAFREGKASEVFEEVRREGTRLVVGDDDSAVCIIMRPEDYVRMSGEFYDVGAMRVAEDRFNHIDRSRLIPAEEVYKEFGITQEMIDAMPEVELE